MFSAAHTIMATAACTALVCACPAAGAQAVGTGDPPANRTLSASTLQTCGADPLGQECATDALGDINAARGSEGVGPMVLPTDFLSLSVPEQLMAVSNLERADRGLTAVAGLSAGLDANAAIAAADDEDPMPSPFYGDAYSANWEGGYPSSLEADFVWMYDDGPGSANGDCTGPGAPGCWGHRHDILDAFAAPIAMGAADGNGQYGASMTELFVGGDGQTAAGLPDAPLAPTWAAIAQLLPVQISPTSLSLNTASSATVDAYVSGESTTVAATLSAPNRGWSVTPATCNLAAGIACRFTVSVSPSGLGTTETLTLSWPTGRQSIPLASHTATVLEMLSRRTTITAGTALTLRGQLLSSAHGTLASQPVRLMARSPGAPAPRLAASVTTSTVGAVSVRVSPSFDTTYTLAFDGTATLGASRAEPIEVLVSPRITAAFGSHAVRAGHTATLTGRVTPGRPARHVALQLQRHQAWVTVATTSIARSGRFTLTVRPSSRGHNRYRVRVSADRQSAQATSSELILRVR
jgi:hypothetical protein